MEESGIIRIKNGDNILGFSSDVVISAISTYEARNGVKLLHQPFGCCDVMVEADTISKIEKSKREAESYVVDINHSLIKKEIPFGQSPYVYFLFDDSCLVYIGQTCDVSARISKHVKTKKFNGVYCQEINKKDLLIAETVNIRKYRPILNLMGWEDSAYLTTILNMSGI